MSTFKIKYGIKSNERKWRKQDFNLWSWIHPLLLSQFYSTVLIWYAVLLPNFFPATVCPFKECKVCFSPVSGALVQHTSHLSWPRCIVQTWQCSLIVFVQPAQLQLCAGVDSSDASECLYTPKMPMFEQKCQNTLEMTTFTCTNTAYCVIYLLLHYDQCYLAFWRYVDPLLYNISAHTCRVQAILLMIRYWPVLFFI